MSERTFTPSWAYDPRDQCWVARVTIDGFGKPCFQRPYTTRFGARFVARRMAAKLTRLERRGEVTD